MVGWVHTWLELHQPSEDIVLVLPLKKSDCNFQTWPTLPLMFIRLKLRLEKYPCLVVSSHHHANNINANNNKKIKKHDVLKNKKTKIKIIIYTAMFTKHYNFPCVQYPTPYNWPNFLLELSGEGWVRLCIQWRIWDENELRNDLQMGQLQTLLPPMVWSTPLYPMLSFPKGACKQANQGQECSCRGNSSALIEM